MDHHLPNSPVEDFESPIEPQPPIAATPPSRDDRLKEFMAALDILQRRYGVRIGAQLKEEPFTRGKVNGIELVALMTFQVDQNWTPLE